MKVADIRVYVGAFYFGKAVLSNTSLLFHFDNNGIISRPAPINTLLERD